MAVKRFATKFDLDSLTTIINYRGLAKFLVVLDVLANGGSEQLADYVAIVMPDAQLFDSFDEYTQVLPCEAAAIGIQISNGFEGEYSYYISFAQAKLFFHELTQQFITKYPEQEVLLARKIEKVISKIDFYIKERNLFLLNQLK